MCGPSLCRDDNERYKNTRIMELGQFGINDTKILTCLAHSRVLTKEEESKSLVVGKIALEEANGAIKLKD